ncbi:uncharacterized protein N177_2548 [Lutibaculum baratangense AMV1]|uniref:L,D-TPase catalytic domain-containing protein n=2 Tax=Lutibaculum TaxID=1358438 RepID=V4RFE5_9HYPH|nr:uncharacterized protein N177_2548 [Lutibaculum baratangense AMV1]
MAAAALSVLALAGCIGEDGNDVAKHLRPLSYQTVAELKANDMAVESPLLIRIFKEESELEVWKQTSAGRFKHFKTYEICAWSGELGPKKKEGDRQAPEGFYTVTPAQMNPNSSYHLSFNIGFPNTFDRQLGRTGKHLMVHGACSSAGCYAMTDEVVQEIYGMARESFRGGQRSFQVQALPFRMTPANMAKHADNPNMPFWRNLKEGVDHFEVTGVPPEVGVCDRRYVFGAGSGRDGGSLSICPKIETPEEVRVAVAQKQMKDEMAFQVALADIRARSIGETPPSEGGNYSPIMVAGRMMPAEEQGSTDTPSEAPQQVAMTVETAQDPARAATPEVVPGVTAEPAASATAYAPTEPFASAVTGVWGRIVEMTRGGLRQPTPEAAGTIDPIETGTVPGAAEQAGSPASLASAFASPRLFPEDPFAVFKMFESVDGVSVPADTVSRR